MALRLTFLRKFSSASTTAKRARELFSRSFLAPAPRLCPQNMEKREGKGNRVARGPGPRRSRTADGSLDLMPQTSAAVGSLSMGWRRSYEAHMTPALYARRPGVGADGIITGLGKDCIQVDKSKPLRPTHFLSLQVSQSEQITETIRKIQDGMVAKYPGLRQALVDPASAHLTLMVMHLDKDNMHYRSPLIEDGIQFLEESLPALETESLLGPLNLSFKGLSTFNNKVLYLGVEPGKDLDRVASLAKALSEQFAVKGVPNNGESFVGHVTVAKLSKIKQIRKNKRKQAKSTKQEAAKKPKMGLREHLVSGSSKGSGSGETEEQRKDQERKQQIQEEAAGEMLRGIPKEAYQDFVDVEAGSCQVNEVHLCRMIGRKAGEYYHVEGRIQLDG